MKIRIKFVGNKEKTMKELSKLCIEKRGYLVIDRVQKFWVNGK